MSSQNKTEIRIPFSGVNHSERGFPLLWQRQCDEPIITVENYEKWYNLFVVHPDKRVEVVDSSLILELSEKGSSLWIDHEFHPRLLLLVAQRYGGCAHAEALEMAAGRWVMAGHGQGVEMAYFLDDNEDTENN